MEKNDQLENSEEMTIEIEEYGDTSLHKESVGMMWHRRLGHISLGHLHRMKNSGEALKGVKFGEDIKDCEICPLSKQERLPFGTKRRRAERPV